MRFAFLNFSWDGLLVLTGEQLRIARETAGITQETLARQIGVSMRSVGNWERGEGVPRNREQRVREVLKGYWPGEVDSPSRAEDLKSVSDARLLAEIARRFERREDVGNDGSASKTQAGESPAAPTEDELEDARQRGRTSGILHKAVGLTEDVPAAVRQHPLLEAAYLDARDNLSADDLEQAAQVRNARDGHEPDSGGTLHELPSAEALDPTVPDDVAARSQKGKGRAQEERDRQDEEGEVP